MSQSKEELYDDLIHAAIRISNKEAQLGILSSKLARVESEIAACNSSIERDKTLLDTTIEQLAKINNSTS